MQFAGLSIVLSTHSAQFEAVAFKGELDANLARIASWGYGGVELAIRDPDLVNAGALEKVLASNGLKVPAIGTGQAWGEEHLSFTDRDSAIRKAAIARIKRQIELAQRFNSLVIIGLIRGVIPPGHSRDQSVYLLVESLSECTDFASTHQVRMAVEPINHNETDLVVNVREALELIQQVGSPNLGLLLDTYHMNIEEASIEESIKQSGKEIFHFHVADSNRWYPGAGQLNFRSILGALKSTGYTGWVSGEFLPLPESSTAAQRSIEFLKSMLI